MSESEKKEPRGLYEKLKTEDDGWEWWAKLAVGLFALQMVAFVVAYLRLGYPSIVAHSIIVPLLGVVTMPLMFWGLIRALFRPPAWRLSRTVAFIALLIAGFFGNASLFAAPVSTGDFSSAHDYRLPFDGQWITLAGGDKKSTNYHVTTPVQRWAYDFAPVVDGKRYTGDGSSLEDHHCYGAPVLAPVDGEVIRVLGGEPDHPPGEYDPNHVLGNHIVVRVDEEEYLFMAHLKRGSLEVGAGDQIRSGQQVASCGNSGRTISPHLHIHIQNTSDFPIAEGLPLRFSDYEANGQAVEIGMPLGGPDYESGRGQIVEARAAATAEVPEAEEMEENEEMESLGEE